MRSPSAWKSKIENLRLGVQRIARPLGPYSLDVCLITVSGVVGVVLALVIQSFEPDDRIVVGNTAGTLTALIESSQKRVMLGAGPSRSHSSDLIGRITRPWDRSIDLLVLPGWDDHHVPGAIGLLERRSVQGIVVVGLPDEDPSWTMLERAASSRDVPISFISRPVSLELSDTSSLLMAELTGDASSGTWTRLSSGGVQVNFFDSDNTSTAQIDPRAAQFIDDHITVSVRSTDIPGQSVPSLAILPQPHWQHEFTNIGAHYWSGIDRNESFTLRLGSNEVRVPQEEVEPGIASGET